MEHYEMTRLETDIYAGMLYTFHFKTNVSNNAFAQVWFYCLGSLKHSSS